MGAPENEDMKKKKQKSSKEVYFSVLPDRYEPLEEEEEEEERKERKEERREETTEERRQRKEEKKRKKKNKYKKYRKNVGKALRFSWRCLMLGLQSMTSSYTSPASAAVAVVTLADARRNAAANRA
ncbi:hypothetical protein PFLUV_G00277170 [Perca fluviatilis]|uniref:Uncharacterized protein n=1 Tax=Perca fluviatilis TaxID=8168 RepID=A0A6A5EDX0_PERFL|nr:nucleolar protein 58-like [Perca fluviatilis]KAF1372022.1 hypothetical protein PFLUV_G00277170 [Perca fluviatilis]